jgi:PilZ domain
MQVEVKGKRAEERTYCKVGVDLSSVDLRTPAQFGVTDNVSAHGARVLTGKALRSNQRLNIRSMLGSYRSRARVVYCVPVAGGMYAIGLQLYASAGDWISPE